MARISTYVIDGSIVDGDKVIGSDANDDMVTKNYTIGDLVSYFAASMGANIFVPYTNANDDVDLGSFNLSASSIIVSDQIVANGSAGNIGQVLISQGPSNPAIWGFNIGSQNLDQVLSNGNTSSKSIILDSGVSSIVLDIEKIYGDVSYYLSDVTNGNYSFWNTSRIHLQDSSLGQEVDYFTDKIQFLKGGNSATIKTTVYSNQNYFLPYTGGAFVMTVNGVAADMSGAVTIPTGGSGTVTSIELLPGNGIGLSGTNPITSSGSITVTNTAPDQLVTLTAGSGIGITGTYPNFTIAATGSSTPDLQSVLGVNNAALNQLIKLSETASSYYVEMSSVDSSYPYIKMIDNNTLLVGELREGQLYVGDAFNNVAHAVNTTGFQFIDTATSTNAYIIGGGNVNGQTLTIPDISGTFVLSVNGNTADSSGNVTISAGASVGFEMNFLLMGA